VYDVGERAVVDIEVKAGEGVVKVVVAQRSTIVTTNDSLSVTAELVRRFVRVALYLRL